MTAEEWIKQIAQYDRSFKRWEQRVEKILKKYKDESRPSGSTARFNILWSNVQTVVPAVFARLPKPDVSRRFKDNDPVGRVAALILERALEFEIEHYPDYRAAMKNSVLDRFLGGRGVSWVRYEPHFKAAEQGTPEDGVQVTEDADEAENEAIETIDYECAPVDYVHWKEFGHSQGRTWEEVTAVWRKVYMKRPALVERFGKEGEKIPLDTKPDKDKREGNDESYEALIYEIWDKVSGNAIWISKSLGKILDERPDPLELDNFFPCPKPLYATLTTDSLEPTPDFTLYQDQANELDILCDRIDGLIKALQVKGLYDSSIPELARLFTEGNNTVMFPVKNWAAFAEKNGLKGAIDLIDLKPIAEALMLAYQAMEQVKQQIYDITGLSDIVRGQSEASETATAQRIKGQYASLRLKAMQGDVSQFAAELLQIKAQIICRFFQPETLMQIAAVDQLAEADRPHVRPAIELLKSGPINSFRIEVSADSLVQLDEEAEKEGAVEFVTAVGGFIAQAKEAPPEAMPFLGDLLKWAAARFKIGKGIEGALDQFVEQAKQKAQQPQVDPAQLEQMQQEIEQGKQMVQAEAAKVTEDRSKLQIETVQKKAELDLRQLKLDTEEQLFDMRKTLTDANGAVEKERQEREQERKSFEFERETTQKMQALKEAEGKTQEGESVADVANRVAEVTEKQAGALTEATTQLSQAAEVIAGAAATMAQAAEQISRPKKRKIERDASGRAVGMIEE